MAPGTVHAEGSLVLGDPPVRRIADIGLAAFGDADLPEARERQRRPVDDAVRGSPAAGFPPQDGLPVLSDAPQCLNG
jgi:hypothetical protein